MRCEMQNFIKIAKRKPTNVGQTKRNEDWKRDRKVARENKIDLRTKAAKELTQ